MNIYVVKQIMKQINAPSEYDLSAFDLNDPNYWIFRVQNVRITPLYSGLSELRPEKARVDVFVNGMYIASNDYILAQIDNDLHIRFIKSNFPTVDGYGNPYIIGINDDVKIKGDLEEIL